MLRAKALAGVLASGYNGGAFDYVPSLEASSLENQFDFDIAGPSVMVGNNQRRQVRRMASWKGVAEPTGRPLWLW
jgi:hypothetical protein